MGILYKIFTNYFPPYDLTFKDHFNCQLPGSRIYAKIYAIKDYYVILCPACICIGIRSPTPVLYNRSNISLWWKPKSQLNSGKIVSGYLKNNIRIRVIFVSSSNPLAEHDEHENDPLCPPPPNCSVANQRDQLCVTSTLNLLVCLQKHFWTQVNKIL